jgi:hypothetical protein
MEIKIQIETHTLTYYEDIIIIEEEGSEEEPLIIEGDNLSKIQLSTLNSIYPIVEWLIKEIKPKKRKYKRKQKEDEEGNA